MNERERLHQLVDELDEQQVPGALRILESLTDPELTVLTDGDEDDTPLTSGERTTIRESAQWVKQE